MSTVKLGDVAIESRDSLKEKDKSLPVVGLEHLIPEQINLTDWNIGQENTFTKIFEKGDVLFGRRRAYLKKTAVAPCKGICSGDITVIRAREDKILPELLPFVIQNDIFFDYAVGKSAGSLSPRVKWEHLANYEFNLPELDEQKKLAEVLWQIVATMESYKKLLAKTDEMVKAKFNELLLKNERTCTIRDYVELPIKKITKDTKFDEIQYIDISSIDKDLRIIQGTTNYQLNNAPSRAQQIVKKNDILISTVRPNLKTFAIINLEADNLIASTGFCVLRVQNCPLYYLYGIINSDIFTNQMISEATGISYPAVNDGNILNFKIPDISEEQQKYLADLVAKSEESKSAIKASLDSLTKIYKKIIAENIG